MSYMLIFFGHVWWYEKEVDNSYAKSHSTIKYMINLSNSIQNGELKGKMLSFKSLRNPTAIKAERNYLKVKEDSL